jgi:hypothetical protein
VTYQQRYKEWRGDMDAILSEVWSAYGQADKEGLYFLLGVAKTIEQFYRLEGDPDRLALCADVIHEIRQRLRALDSSVPLENIYDPRSRLFEFAQGKTKEAE